MLALGPSGFKGVIERVRLLFLYEGELGLDHQRGQTLALFLGFQIPTRFLEGVTRREQGRV